MQQTKLTRSPSDEEAYQALADLYGEEQSQDEIDEQQLTEQERRANDELLEEIANPYNIEGHTLNVARDNDNTKRNTVGSVEIVELTTTRNGTWASESGELVGDLNDQKIKWVAPLVTQDTKIRHTTQTGASKTLTYKIIEPTGAYFNATGTYECDKGMAGAGFLGMDPIFEPGIVSFGGLLYCEGGGKIASSGCFSPSNGKTHTRDKWRKIRDDNTSEVTDYIRSQFGKDQWNETQKEVTAAERGGALKWPIEWEYKAEGGGAVSHFIQNHNANATCHAVVTISKGKQTNTQKAPQGFVDSP